MGSLFLLPSWALDPQQASVDYDRYAASYNQLDGTGGSTAASSLGLDQARQALISQASGNVLEIGVGTGLNLPYYNPQQVKSLTLVDVSQGMLSQAKQTLQQLEMEQQQPRIPKVSFVQADATTELVDLFGEDAFDTVLDTFSLCVMGTSGAQRCLEQMSRVVKKKKTGEGGDGPAGGGGKLLLLENAKSSNPVLSWYQDATAEAAAAIGGKGCVYNQDVRQLILETARKGAAPSFRDQQQDHHQKLVIEREDLYAMGVFRAFVVSWQNTT